MKVDDIMHLLDSAEPDIRFVVEIEADIGRSEAEILKHVEAIKIIKKFNSNSRMVQDRSYIL